MLVVSHGGVTPLIMAHLLQLPRASEASARISRPTTRFTHRLRGQQAPQVWKLIGKESLEQL